jgi:hypothetical protein
MSGAQLGDQLICLLKELRLLQAEQGIQALLYQGAPAVATQSVPQVSVDDAEPDHLPAACPYCGGCTPDMSSISSLWLQQISASTGTAFQLQDTCHRSRSFEVGAPAYYL